MTDAGFIAIRSAGGLLPIDTLKAVVEGKGLGGLTPSDYHLLPGETLRGEANRAWQRLLGAWRVFNDSIDALPDGDPAIGTTSIHPVTLVSVEVVFARYPKEIHG